MASFTRQQIMSDSKKRSLNNVPERYTFQTFSFEKVAKERNKSRDFAERGRVQVIIVHSTVERRWGNGL
jgi:hypothetical protein